MKRTANLLLVMMSTLALLTACMPPSDEDIEMAIRQTQTAEKTIAPKPTMTTAPTRSLCLVDMDLKREWETIFCDSFDDNKNDWWTGTNLDMGIISTISNGKYTIDYNSQNQTGYTSGFYTALNFIDAQDYVVTLTGQIKSKYKDCMWGIIVRGDYRNGYGFIISNQGKYYLTYEGSKTNEYLGNIKTGTHNAIRWDEPNTITILVEGENMTFFVNEEPIISHEAENASYQEISWTVWAAEGVTATFEFDDLLVREK